MTNKRNIMVAIPCYDSKVYALTMVSIFNNLDQLKKSGIDGTFTFKMGNPYLDLSRNQLVNDFLKSECTDLIFVDSDVAFDRDCMEKLMVHDVQVIGGVYPYKSATDNGYPVDIKLDEDKFPIVDKEKKLIECSHLPTGMLRIQRSVFETLKAKYPHKVDHKGILNFFPTGQVEMYEDVIGKLVNEVKRLKEEPCRADVSIDANDPYKNADLRWFGEDVYFCRLCEKVGIKMYCDPTIGFVHFGSLLKHGKYSDFLKEGGKWIDNPNACDVTKELKEDKG